MQSGFGPNVARDALKAIAQVIDGVVAFGRAGGEKVVVLFAVIQAIQRHRAARCACRPKSQLFIWPTVDLAIGALRDEFLTTWFGAQINWLEHHISVALWVVLIEIKVVVGFHHGQVACAV